MADSATPNKYSLCLITTVKSEHIKGIYYALDSRYLDISTSLALISGIPKANEIISTCNFVSGKKQ